MSDYIRRLIRLRCLALNRTMALLCSQKNAIFWALEEAGADPGDFYWDEDARGSILHRRNTDFFCRLESGANWHEMS